MKQWMTQSHNMPTLLAIAFIVIAIAFVTSLSEAVIVNTLIIGGFIVFFLIVWFAFAFLVRWFIKIATGQNPWQNHDVIANESLCIMFSLKSTVKGGFLRYNKYVALASSNKENEDSQLCAYTLRCNTISTAMWILYFRGCIIVMCLLKNN